MGGGGSIVYTSTRIASRLQSRCEGSINFRISTVRHCPATFASYILSINLEILVRAVNSASSKRTPRCVSNLYAISVNIKRQSSFFFFFFSLNLCFSGRFIANDEREKDEKFSRAIPVLNQLRGNRFNRTIFTATRENYRGGGGGFVLIRHSDSAVGAEPFRRRQNDCSDSMRSGIWQLAVWRGGRMERRNKLSQCCRADEKSLSGRKRSAGLSPPFSLSLHLSVCLSHPRRILVSAPSLILFLLVSTLFRRAWRRESAGI